MRSLASALGTGPMTLYNYLDGRGGVEELVVDAIAAQVTPVENLAAALATSGLSGFDLLVAFRAAGCTHARRRPVRNQPGGFELPQSVEP